MRPDAQPLELTEGDAPAVAALFVRCADDFLLQDGVVPGLADAVALFTDVPPEKAVRDQTILGWRDDQGLYAVAAILCDYPCADSWYLGLLLVDVAQRGRGLGRTLYGTVAAWAVSRGAREMRLAVLEANVAADRFWRSLGFVERRRVGPDRFKKKLHRRIELSQSLLAKSGT